MRTIFSVIVSCFIYSALSAQFLPNQLVVLRTGDGLPSLSGTAVPVTLLQYNLLDTNQLPSYLLNMPVLPSTQSGFNRALTLGSSSVAEGDIALTVNGQYLVLAGYNAAPNTVSVTNTSVEGVVAKVDSQGNIHTKTSYNRLAVYTNGSIRSACSIDGTAFWTTGSGSGTTLRFIQSDSVNATGIAITSTGSVGTTRTAQIADNQLYCSANSLGIKLGKVGTGLPVTAGQVTVNLPGIPQGNIEPYGYQFLDLDVTEPGLDVLYMACIGGPTNSDSSGIFKFSKVGGTWVGNGYLTGNARAVACMNTCNNVVDLYITRSDSKTTKPNALVAFSDLSGYNGMLPGGTSLQNTKVLATSGANFSFNGVCFTPGTSFQPLNVSITATPILCNGGNSMFEVTATGGVEPYFGTGSGVAIAGTITGTVTDAKGCTVSQTITVGEPTVLKLQKCYSPGSKILGMKATGGTPPYEYTANGGTSYQAPNALNNTARAYTNRNPGSYNIGVKDANGCIKSELVNTATLPNCPTLMTENQLKIETKIQPGIPGIYVKALTDQSTKVACEIYNLSGQKILSQQINTNQWIHLDKALPPGMYSVVLRYKDQHTSASFFQ